MGNFHPITMPGSGGASKWFVLPLEWGAVRIRSVGGGGRGRWKRMAWPVGARRQLAGLPEAETAVFFTGRQNGLV
jgi:hypothetical protein